jgi:transposase-like protein
METRSIMSKEEFTNANWKMTYEQYEKCYCPDCTRENCIHRGAYRRVPEIDGGLGLCPNLSM